MRRLIRALSDNGESEEVVVAAHVRRTEQKASEPPGFLRRHSMPGSDGPAYPLAPAPLLSGTTSSG